jgi:hypothetical protein
LSRRTLLLAGVAVAIVAIGGAYWAFRTLSEPDIPQRTVAFDNLYGSAAEVPIFVTVDGGLEQDLTATCDAKACTFKLPLTNARHELTVSVVHDGRRSAPAHVTVDTTNLP